MLVDEEITAAASEAVDAEIVEEAVEHRPDSTPTVEALPVPVELRREERTSTNARECREVEKQRINDQCSFCGYGPHNPKHCFYLQEVPDCDWVLSSAVRSLSGAIRDRNEKQGRVSLAVQTYLAETPQAIQGM
jgi:hypothetical protein